MHVAPTTTFEARTRWVADDEDTRKIKTTDGLMELSLSLLDEEFSIIPTRGSSSLIIRIDPHQLQRIVNNVQSLVEQQRVADRAITLRWTHRYVE